MINRIKHIPALAITLPAAAIAQAANDRAASSPIVAALRWLQALLAANAAITVAVGLVVIVGIAMLTGRISSLVRVHRS